jgi:AcrR family transcriptional regulator
MGIATREHLMDVAEELMAERGVDAVELNDIRIAAGQRNRSVVNYHFGDRAGLVRAIRQRHGERIDDERNCILDELEANGAVTVRALVKAYVQPLGRCLRTLSGRNHVIILRDTNLRTSRVCPICLSSRENRAPCTPSRKTSCDIKI